MGQPHRRIHGPLGGCKYPQMLSTTLRSLELAGKLVWIQLQWNLCTITPLELRRGLTSVAVRKDDAPAAGQAAITNIAAVTPFSGGGGLIQTTSG